MKAPTLQLHRASAGSGKTYQLAKEFIWLYLTRKEENGPRELRQKGEFAEALSQVLAVTFTNKATKEMKTRIIDRLADLAPSSGIPDDKVDYLIDFSRDLKVEPKVVRERAAEALECLLFNYSSFQISTIDSFFQRVLRAFAYESNLKSGYQVELDDDFIDAAAIDATLAQVNSREKQEKVAEWIRLIIKESSGHNSKWNLFQKSQSFQASYRKLLDFLKLRHKEAYQKLDSEMLRYFICTDYLTAYKEFNARMDNLQKEAHGKMVDMCREVRTRAEGLENGEYAKDIGKSVVNAWDNLAKRSHKNTDPKGLSAILKKSFPFLSTCKYFKKGAHAEERESINALLEEIARQYKIWSNPEFTLWENMRGEMLHLGLQQAVNAKSKEILNDANLVQLSKTNMILSKIIGQEETPFIYEKIGGRINHYLIDEFQDTSELQWKNFRPLLAESLSQEKENLLIGDAKQSIYRFRNADSTLITEKVPAEFEDLSIKGDRIAENSNYRSSQGIIELNNSLFHLLPAAIDAKLDTALSPVYAGAVQKVPEKAATGGYAEFNFLYWKDKTDEEEDNKDLQYPPHLDGLGDRIHELLARNYRLRDIAILVRRNAEGRKVINALMKYNAEHPELRPIAVISDESLLVASSGAVRNVVEVLRMMVQPAKENPSEEENAPRRLDCQSIATNFNFFMLDPLRKEEREGKTRAELLADFLEDPEEYGSIDSMLGNMQAMTLPAIVEAIIGRFLSATERRDELPFLAAFQDAALDFSQLKGSDIPAFLEWWDAKKGILSISSPASADALTISTIHKAKGLEYKVVIMPLLDMGLAPSTQKAEVAWVKKERLFSDAPELPPYLPLPLTAKLADTDFKPLYDGYRRSVALDELNSFYVGMTRAINEVIVWCKVPKKGETSSLYTFLKEALDRLPALRNECGDPDLIPYLWNPERPKAFPEPAEEQDSGNESGQEGAMVYVFGEKCFAKEDDDVSSDDWILPTYHVNPHHPPVRINISPLDAGEEEAEDPRSRGSRLHAIMELVTTADTLDNALRKKRIEGVISRREMKEFGDFLHQAIASPEVREYFTPRYRVLTEAPILCQATPLDGFSKTGMLRPDRIMADNDNPSQVVILDYKFGKKRQPGKYSRQLRRYAMAFQKANPGVSVRCLIWYVELNTTEGV